MKALTCSVEGDDGAENNRVMGWLGQQIFTILDAELRVFSCLYAAVVQQQFYDPASQDPKYLELSQDIARTMRLNEIMIGNGQKNRRAVERGEMFSAIFAALYIDGGCSLHECAEWFYNNVGKNQEYQRSLTKKIINPT
eukprot:TRINITY_DN20182_c0_g1_i2.p4 TRINITY_DN20182_c0_g1~~TRINITY_DN20182_c0_g1_i2.p4  ORF type:complete len:160 (-),score=25.64 TRINITY_DN20182_c0_g1_i2:514-930(-)